MTETTTQTESIEKVATLEDKIKDLRPQDRVIFYNLGAEVEGLEPKGEDESVSASELFDFIDNELSRRKARDIEAAIEETLEAYDSELDDVDYAAVMKGALSLGGEQAKKVVLRVASSEKVTGAIAAVETALGDRVEDVKREAGEVANTTRRGFSILGAEVIMGATKWFEENGDGIRDRFKEAGAKAMEGVTTEMARMEAEQEQAAQQAAAEEKAAEKAERKWGRGLFGGRK